MELELGLSMSNYNCVSNHKIPILKEPDLISYVNCEEKQDYYSHYDDHLSALSCESSSVNDCEYDQEEVNYGLCKNKRRFLEVESSEFCQSKTLALLFWDKQPNEDDKEPKSNSLCNSFPFTITKNEDENIVGWPPVKTYRKRQNYGHQGQHCGCNGRNIPAVDNGGYCGGSTSLYVKVQMEGCFITRKINLKLYHSYHTLTSTLLHMFGKGEDGMDDYKLTYQDGEGNWLLVGDNVTWR
ncbi:hypothetical protein KSS87_005757 [Heliosperma pusillum]|nr:hypothetical protein KSS87_005757 [Heliosperma pusillum]